LKIYSYFIFDYNLTIKINKIEIINVFKQVILLINNECVKYLMANQTILGILLNVCGSICISLGTNIIQYSYDVRKSENTEVLRRISKFRKLWILGYIFFVVGNLVNFISLSFATQIILSSITSSVLILSNISFNFFIKKNKLDKNTIIGSLSLISGSILALIFANHKPQVFTVDEMEDLYKRLTYILFIVIEVLLLLVFFIIYRISKDYKPSNHSLNEQTSNNVNLGCLTYPCITPFSYITMCCIIGTHSLIFAKSFSELLRLTIVDKDNQLNDGFTYLILFFLILTSSFWITRLNKILKRYQQAYIIPTQQSFWTIFSIISGGIYFKEFEKFSTLEFIMFLLGMCFIILGIAIIKPPDLDTSNTEEIEIERLDSGNMVVDVIVEE